MFGYKSKEFEGKFLSLIHRYFSPIEKKQAIPLLTIWLDKQNKQLLIAINKLFLSRFSKPGQADSPHDDFSLRRLQRSCNAARIFS